MGQGPVASRREVKQVVQSSSVLKFIPSGQEVPNILIHLLSLIFLRIISFLQHLSMTMTEKSVIEWPMLLKWGATGDPSVLQYDISKPWPFILQCSC